MSGHPLLSMGDCLIQYLSYCCNSFVWFIQAAIKGGTLSVHKPWHETDEDGTETFATVQTVSISITTLNSNGVLFLQSLDWFTGLLLEPLVTDN